MIQAYIHRYSTHRRLCRLLYIFFFNKKHYLHCAMKQRRTVNAMGADSLLEEINYFLFTVVADQRH